MRWKSSHWSSVAKCLLILVVQTLGFKPGFRSHRHRNYGMDDNDYDENKYRNIKSGFEGNVLDLDEYRNIKSGLKGNVLDLDELWENFKPEKNGNSAVFARKESMINRNLAELWKNFESEQKGNSAEFAKKESMTNRNPAELRKNSESEQKGNSAEFIKKESKIKGNHVDLWENSKPEQKGNYAEFLKKESKINGNHVDDTSPIVYVSFPTGIKYACCCCSCDGRNLPLHIKGEDSRPKRSVPETEDFEPRHYRYTLKDHPYDFMKYNASLDSLAQKEDRFVLDKNGDKTMKKPEKESKFFTDNQYSRKENKISTNNNNRNSVQEEGEKETNINLEFKHHEKLTGSDNGSSIQQLKDRVDLTSNNSSKKPKEKGKVLIIKNKNNWTDLLALIITNFRISARNAFFNEKQKTKMSCVFDFKGCDKRAVRSCSTLVSNMPDVSCSSSSSLFRQSRFKKQPVRSERSVEDDIQMCLNDLGNYCTDLPFMCSNNRSELSNYGNNSYALICDLF